MRNQLATTLAFVAAGFAWANSTYICFIKCKNIVKNCFYDVGVMVRSEMGSILKSTVTYNCRTNPTKLTSPSACMPWFDSIPLSKRGSIHANKIWNANGQRVSGQMPAWCPGAESRRRRTKSYLPSDSANGHTSAQNAALVHQGWALQAISATQHWAPCNLSQVQRSPIPEWLIYDALVKPRPLLHKLKYHSAGDVLEFAFVDVWRDL